MLRALGSRSTSWWGWSPYRSPDVLPGVRDLEVLQVRRGWEPQGRGALSGKVLLTGPRGSAGSPHPKLLSHDSRPEGLWNIVPRRLC